MTSLRCHFSSLISFTTYLVGVIVVPGDSTHVLLGGIAENWLLNPPLQHRSRTLKGWIFDS